MEGMRTGKVPEAQKQLAGALAGSNDPTAIRLGVGFLEVICGNSADGIVAVGRVLASDPKNVRALVNKAVALDIMGRQADSQPLYRPARTMAPNVVPMAADKRSSTPTSGW